MQYSILLIYISYHIIDIINNLPGHLLVNLIDAMHPFLILNFGKQHHLII